MSLNSLVLSVLSGGGLYPKVLDSAILIKTLTLLFFKKSVAIFSFFLNLMPKHVPTSLIEYKNHKCLENKAVTFEQISKVEMKGLGGLIQSLKMRV